jgi:hypothetical protein
MCSVRTSKKDTKECVQKQNVQATLLHTFVNIPAYILGAKSDFCTHAQH